MGLYILFDGGRNEYQVIGTGPLARVGVVYSTKEARDAYLFKAQVLMAAWPYLTKDEEGHPIWE